MALFYKKDGGGWKMNQEEQMMLDDILLEHEYNQSTVISMMQEIQRKYHYLPEEMLDYLAKKLQMSEAKIYGVATFYENFSLKPKGRFLIKVCDGTACHVRKSIPILEELRTTLKVSEEKPTTPDMLFTVETVSCLGACGLAPVCTVNEKVYPNMTPAKVKKLIQELQKEVADDNTQP
jgi:NADH-quinone oxidoreductase subunit E